MPTFGSPDLLAHPCWRLLTAGLRAAVLLSAVLTTASAQTPQPQTVPPQASEPAAPPKPPEDSGLLGEIGKLLTAPAALLPSLKPADPASEPPPAPDPAPTPPPVPADNAANPPPGSRLLPGIVSGRELCPRADNGAPDCKTGSDRLCRSKGYTEGKSLSTDSVFACSAKVRGKPCANENYVTRAFCR